MEMSEEKEPQYKVPNEEAIKADLDVNTPNDDVAKIEIKADKVLDSLLNPQLSDSAKREAVDTMGASAQIEVANLSKMLEQPIKDMGKAGTTGGKVAESIIDLKNTVEDLDPAKFDLRSFSGFMERLSRFIPFIGNRLSRYFARYMKAEDVLARIIESMEMGKDELSRDNITLSNDKDRMMAGMGKLKRNIELGRLLDQKLSFKLEQDIAADDPKRQFIQNDLLFPLRQRVLDLQQTLAVNQQSILTSEIIIRNNRELIKGVERSLTVTISALQTAVAAALALNNQEIVLKKIQAINETTSKLISDNARRLKQHGADIHKKASEATISIDDLEQSFRDIRHAMNDLSSYKEAALPKLKQSMDRMEKLTSEGFEAIKEIKTKKESASGEITIDLDDDDYEIVE